MAEIIPFPSSGRVPAATIPRAEFERLAESAVVPRVGVLDLESGCHAGDF